MRRVIGSLVIGTALVLAVMVLVGTTMAAGPDGRATRADRPLALDDPIGRRISPFGGPGGPSREKHVKFRGTIDQLPTDTLTGTWTILDEMDQPRTVSVTEQTKIVPPTIDPQVGDWAQVLARPHGDDETVFVAKQIVVKAKGPGPAYPVEFHGEIEALPVATGTATGTQSYLGEWVVSGFTVTVDSRTMIHPHKRTPEIGMRANVISFRQDDGTLWAKNIALHKADAEAEAEFEGPIESLPAEGYLGTWVVDGISVTVSETTTLKGAPPAVGLMAQVKGSLTDGGVAATEIKVKGPGDQEVEFEGTLVATDTIPGEWVIETATERISVTVDADTYLNTNKGPIEIGIWVEVKALEQPDGTLLAVRIKVEGEGDGPPDREEAAFDGIIEELPPAAPHSYKGHWIVEADGDRITVLVTGDTDIDGEPAVDLEVTVEGIWQGQGFVHAESIDIQE